MFKFLLLILLFIIIFPILRLILSVWGATRRFKKQYKDFASGRETGSTGGFYQRSAFRKRKKIFTKEDGEYVEFEEIQVEKTTVTDNSEVKEESYNESQITDAKFEDIKN